MRRFFGQPFSKQEIRGAMLLLNCSPGKAIRWLSKRPTEQEVTLTRVFLGTRAARNRKLVHKICIRQRREKALAKYRFVRSQKKARQRATQIA